MRAVILGTDLMYDKSGRLIPIEINTNIGYDTTNRVEKDWLDLSGLIKYIKANKIKRVFLDGSTSTLSRVQGFEEKLQAVKGLTVEFVSKEPNTVKDELYVRIQFNEEALLDFYCRDKVVFLKVLANSSKISQMFLYKEDGRVKGEMKDFVDNGPDRPNYIVKFRYPSYSIDYPKFYKLSSLEDVYKLAESFEDGYFIMPCYLNEDNMYEGNRYKLYRQWSLIVPDEELTLKAINLGTYTKLSGKVDFSKVKFNENGELVEGRDMFLSKRWMKPIQDVLLEAGDEVLMADGTWKVIEDLKVGDEVRAVDVPHAEDVDIRKHAGDYKVDEKELEEDSKYSVNKVSSIRTVESFQDIVYMTFEEDGEDWWDTAESSYLTQQNEESVGFKEIRELKVGDVIYLINLKNASDPKSEEVEYVKRTVKSISTERKFTKGYTISVTGSHLFVTRAQDSNAGYVSIEHNWDDITVCWNRCGSVGKFDDCYEDRTDGIETCQANYGAGNCFNGGEITLKGGVVCYCICHL